MKNHCFLKAFTMAEVLITIGIIGIVAAMTLPTIIVNCEDKILENQSKKTQNVLANGMRRVMANDEVNELEYTDLIGCNGEYECVKRELEQVFNIVAEIKPDSKNVPQQYIFEDGVAPVFTDPEGMQLIYSFVTLDGQIFGVKDFTNQDTSISFVGDVNGGRNPNKGAHDLCMYDISNGGTLTENCAQMAKLDLADELSCQRPESDWDNCSARFYEFLFLGKICAACKSGYKLVKPDGRYLTGYCVPQGCD